MVKSIKQGHLSIMLQQLQDLEEVSWLTNNETCPDIYTFCLRLLGLNTHYRVGIGNSTSVHWHLDV